MPIRVNPVIQNYLSGLKVAVSHGNLPLAKLCLSRIYDKLGEGSVAPIRNIIVREAYYLAGETYRLFSSAEESWHFIKAVTLADKNKDAYALWRLVSLKANYDIPEFIAAKILGEMQVNRASQTFLQSLGKSGILMSPYEKSTIRHLIEWGEKTGNAESRLLFLMAAIIIAKRGLRESFALSYLQEANAKDDTDIAPFLPWYAYHPSSELGQSTISSFVKKKVKEFPFITEPLVTRMWWFCESENPRDSAMIMRERPDPENWRSIQPNESVWWDDFLLRNNMGAENFQIILNRWYSWRPKIEEIANEIMFAR